jgi:hypothetical protein
MVGLEAAYHGTAVTNIFCATGTCVPVAWQLSIGSNFLKTLNADDSASAVGFARVRYPLGAARVP